MNAIAQEQERAVKLARSSPEESPAPACPVRRRLGRLISAGKVRRYLLDVAASQRAHKFKRVSPKTIDEIENVVRNWCRRHVAAAPSKGVTL
jgi:hypothetical protein